MVAQNLSKDTEAFSRSSNLPLDLETIRADFPILGRPIHNKRLVYLDNGASAQKPRQVIDCVKNFYEQGYANVHRGAHTLSGEATELFEGVRDKVAAFMGTPNREEIVFTRNATEAINLVAATYGRTFLSEGDEVIISYMEHHANIVPWQLLETEKGIKVKAVPVTEEGIFDLEAYKALLSPRTKLVAVTQCSNVLGSFTPIEDIINLAHAQNVPVLVDGSQAIVHKAVDVKALDADFYVFTGHKLYGPSGIGVLYGKQDYLEKMPPYMGGGDMIDRVSFEGTTFREAPYRFEAGTPPIAQAIGLGAAIDYVSAIGMGSIAAHESLLLAEATARLQNIPGLRIIGQAPGKAAIISFVHDEIHAHDMATILDHSGVAVRAGQHCAEPLMDRFAVTATARASFGLYNGLDDVEALEAAIYKAIELFS